MKLLSAIIAGFGLLGLMACSNHNRESDSLLTAADVQTLLQDLEGAQASGTGGGDMATALALKDQDGAFVFVSYAPTPSMKIANVVSFFDFAAFGFPDGTGVENITDARVVFIETPSQEVALIIGLKIDGADWSYWVGNGQGSISNGTFSADLNGIRVRTHDLEDGELAGVIQLRLFDSSDNYLGKIPTLTGFSL